MSSWVRRADRTIGAQLASYRRELSGAITGRAAATVACSRCGLALAPRRSVLESRHCPRCDASKRSDSAPS